VTKAQPAVSVLVATYNRPHGLDRAICSVVSQQFASWELLILHDGGCHTTKSIAEEWQTKDSRVRYLHRETPAGIGAALNFGMELSRGRYIAVLDDDDAWIDTEKLKLQTDFLDANPLYVACGGGAVVIDESGRETMRHLKSADDAQIRRGLLVANPIIHSTILFRSSAVRAIGGYDESLSGFQDWDLWLRLGTHGKFYNFQRYFTAYMIWQSGGSSISMRSNSKAAMLIVMRHRRSYTRFPLAFLLAGGYRVYAGFPEPLRRITFAPLSRLKKKVFSVRHAHLPSTDPDGCIKIAAIAPSDFQKDIEQSSLSTRE
jgi:glycosyltransferase involved in cell wall biosynthesis